MRGWMGGKRRHITVRRRDPIARQRLQFARRRELARQFAPRAQRTGARVNLDGIEEHTTPDHRHQVSSHERGPRVLQNASNRERKDSKQQRYQCGDDLIMIGDPSQLESLVPEFRKAKKRLRDHIVREEREPKHQSVSLGQEQSDAYDCSFPSNDIRIFDADDEKTPLFRRRTLPSSFFNSEDTKKHRTSKYFAKDTKCGSKKLKVTATPELSSRLANLKFSTPRAIESFKRVAKDANPKGIRVRKRSKTVTQQPRVLSNSVGNFEHVRSDDDGHELAVIAPSKVFEPSDVLGQVRDPTENLVHQRMLEFPEYVQSSRVRRKIIEAPSQLPSPRSYAVDGKSHQNKAIPRLESRFPFIEADSDSSQILSPVENQQDRLRIGFHSLLASEPIAPNDFSAEVQEFEAKLFGRPDSEGGRFHVRRRRSQPSEREGLHCGLGAVDELRIRVRAEGLAVERALSSREAKYIKPKVRTSDEKGKNDLSMTWDSGEHGHEIVDVKLITSEQSPTIVARGSTHGSKATKATFII